MSFLPILDYGVTPAATTPNGDGNPVNSNPNSGTVNNTAAISSASASCSNPPSRANPGGKGATAGGEGGPARGEGAKTDGAEQPKKKAIKAGSSGAGGKKSAGKAAAKGEEKAEGKKAGKGKAGTGKGAGRAAGTGASSSAAGAAAAAREKEERMKAARAQVEAHAAALEAHRSAVFKLQALLIREAYSSVTDRGASSGSSSGTVTQEAGKPEKVTSPTVTPSFDVRASQLAAACRLLSRSEYDAVVEERAIGGVCGNPLCNQVLQARAVCMRTSGSVALSLPEHRELLYKDDLQQLKENFSTGSGTGENGAGATGAGGAGAGGIDTGASDQGSAGSGATSAGADKVATERLFSSGGFESAVHNAIEGYVPRHGRKAAEVEGRTAELRPALKKAVRGETGGGAVGMQREEERHVTWAADDRLAVAQAEGGNGRGEGGGDSERIGQEEKRGEGSAAGERGGKERGGVGKGKKQGAVRDGALPFHCTLLMALQEWVTADSLRLIYPSPPQPAQPLQQSQQPAPQQPAQPAALQQPPCVTASLEANGWEYPTLLGSVNDPARAAEIRRTLGEGLGRETAGVVEELGLLLPLSTVEHALTRLLATFAFRSPLPSLRRPHWQLLLLLLLEALSVNCLPAAAASALNSHRHQVYKVAAAAGVDRDNYLLLRQMLLPRGPSVSNPNQHTNAAA
ncbi:unnamed protein product [Closterium sp. Yama58-4]|nr:unnamed protein product [Closterium sp. Yama58-4]